MKRDEAIRLLATSDLRRLSAAERREQLETILRESWERDPSWRQLPSDIRTEFEGKELLHPPESGRYDAILMMSCRYQYCGARNEYIIDRLAAIGRSIDSIDGEPEQLQPCPCCGFATLEEPDFYDICTICWWEDDGQDNETADDVRGGPNAKLSLTQARVNFFVAGISDPSRHDLRSLQEPREKFVSRRTFALSEDRRIVREPQSGWESTDFVL